jgi:hypothetical protein
MRLSIRPALRDFIKQKAHTWKVSPTDALNRIVEDARLAELDDFSPPTQAATNTQKSRDSDPLADDIFGEMV